MGDMIIGGLIVLALIAFVLSICAIFARPVIIIRNEHHKFYQKPEDVDDTEFFNPIMVD